MASAEIQTPKLMAQLSGYRFIVAGHLETSPGVAYLELARPQSHNSFHEELWDEFPRALRELDASDATRVIIISGQGKNFCAGIDVRYLRRNFLSATGSAPSPAALSPAGTTAAVTGAVSNTAGPRGAPRCPGEQRAGMRRGILALQDAYTEVERCRSPVIAAVHGRCIGGGVDLVTACDLRICSEDASFCVKEVDLAIAADLGTLQRLPHIVGHGVAMDLALTARTVGAEEALRIGLVSSVVPTSHTAGGGGGGGGSGGRAAVVAAAVQLGTAIASKPRLAVQGTKRVLLHARDHPRVDDGLEYVATWNSAQLISTDLMEAMARMAKPQPGPTAAGVAGPVAASGPGNGGQEQLQGRQRARL